MICEILLWVNIFIANLCFICEINNILPIKSFVYADNKESVVPYCFACNKTHYLCVCFFTYMYMRRELLSLFAAMNAFFLMAQEEGQGSFVEHFDGPASAYFSQSHYGHKADEACILRRQKAA